MTSLMTLMRALITNQLRKRCSSSESSLAMPCPHSRGGEFEESTLAYELKVCADEDGETEEGKREEEIMEE